MVPSATLATADGRWVIVGGNGDSVYTRLMAAVGRPDMGAQNPLYQNNAARCAREAEIYKVRPLKPCSGSDTLSTLGVAITGDGRGVGALLQSAQLPVLRLQGRLGQGNIQVELAWEARFWRKGKRSLARGFCH